MIFSKGKARSLRIDAKKTKDTETPQYMSGTTQMLPAMFDILPVARKNKIHQSELPLTLCERILQFVTRQGETVLDTFAGSGVVGEAALNLKRSCILIELAHRNILKIRDRLAGNPFFREAFWKATPALANPNG